MTGVLIVDDHPTFRYGMQCVVEAEPGLRVCATAGNAGEALAAARREKPGLALIDIAIPGVNGIELIKALHAEHPKLGMLALSMHSESLYALRAVRAGALGYITKDAPFESIVAAIRRVAAGHLALSEELSGRLLARALSHGETESHPQLDRLSTRELEILSCYGRGLDSRAICEQTGIGIKTVETYRTRIKQKLGLDDFADLRRFAGEWLDQEQSPS